MVDNGFPHTYTAVREELVRRLSGAPNYLMQLVAGPRQVGKTTLLLELERRWPQRSVYAAADAPEAMLPGWWENLWSRLERLSQKEVPLLLLDEIQYFPHWPRLLKSKVDELKRRRLAGKDLSGVLEFCRRRPGFRPLLVCDPGQESIGAAAGVASVSWPTFLLTGVASVT